MSTAAFRVPRLAYSLAVVGMAVERGPGLRRFLLHATTSQPLGQTVFYPNNNLAIPAIHCKMI
jgi:hypothetical protein